jgi:hypothetical protein
MSIKTPSKTGVGGEQGETKRADADNGCRYRNAGFRLQYAYLFVVGSVCRWG